MKKYDFAIVGAGLFGSVFAREVLDAGKSVLVIEARDHIGGNCYTEEKHGVHVHKYGPHIFHTANKKVWDYINRFSKFNNYRVHVKSLVDNQLISIPINLMTFNQVFGVTSPQQISKVLEEQRVDIKEPKNLEEWCLSQVGPRLYHMLIEGYTFKQWGRHPRELPSSIIQRLPIRYTANDRYFPDKDIYEGLPVGGYTQIFHRLLEGAEVKLATNFFQDKKSILNIAENIVYTGSIDAFYDYRFGYLPYRTLRINFKEFNYDYQGMPVVNHPSINTPYTRVAEYQHFDGVNAETSTVSFEYPEEWIPGKEPYYPLVDPKSQAVALKYKEIRQPNIIFGGRLASYQYYDMHQIIAQALKISHDTLS